MPDAPRCAVVLADDDGDEDGDVDADVDTDVDTDGDAIVGKESGNG